MSSRGPWSWSWSWVCCGGEAGELTSNLKERFKVPRGAGDLERECLCPWPWPLLWEWDMVAPERTKVEEAIMSTGEAAANARLFPRTMENT